MKIKNNQKITFIKTDIINVHAKVALEWQPLMSSQHTKDMTTSHFDVFLHIQIIFKLHNSYPWVDIHVGSIFINIWLQVDALGVVNAAEKSSLDQKLVAWEGRGYDKWTLFYYFLLVTALYYSKSRGWNFCALSNIYEVKNNPMIFGTNLELIWTIKVHCKSMM